MNSGLSLQVPVPIEILAPNFRIMIFVLVGINSKGLLLLMITSEIDLDYPAFSCNKAVKELAVLVHSSCKAQCYYITLLNTSQYFTRGD